MPPSVILLFEDETIIRLFPGLRRGWSMKGEQAQVPISGKNARRVLFGAINMRTGHCIVAQYPNMGQVGFQAFLHLLQRRYRATQIWMLLDGAGCHKTLKSLQVAEELKITLIGLPKQCPELNAMDHLWRAVKADVSSNFQYPSIDHHTIAAEKYILNLSNKEALKKAGILSENFWLKAFLK